MKEKLRALRSKPFVRNGFIVLVVFYVILGIAGFFAAPSYLKPFLLERLSAELGREVTIERVSVNPYMLSVDIGTVAVKEKDGQGIFFSFDNLHVNAQLASIFKGGPVLSEVRLEKPYINIVRHPDATYNFSDLLDRKSSAEPKKDEKKAEFSLNNIQIANGSIDFLDGPKNAKHAVRDLRVTVPFISTVSYDAETFVEPLLEAVVNDTKVSFKGKTKPFANSLETYFDINLSGFNLEKHLVYVPYKLDFVLKSGIVDSASKLTYTQYSDRPPTFNLAGTIDLRKIELDDLQQRPVLRLPHVALSIAKSDLFAKNVHFSSIAQQSPELYLRRDAAGNVNWHSFLTRAMQDSAKEKDAGTSSKVQKQAKPEKTSSSAVVEIDSFTTKDGLVSWQDSLHGQQFATTLSGVQSRITGLSSLPEKKAQVTASFRTEADEQIALGSLLQLEPLVAEGSISLQQVRLKKYQPYLREATLAQIQDGTLNLWSRFSYTKAEPEALIRLWDLESSLLAFKARKQGEKRDFIELPIVTLRGTEIDLAKRALVIGELSGTKGMLSLTRQQDGTINVMTLTPEKKAAVPVPVLPDSPAAVKPARQPQEKPWFVTLKKVSASDYAVKFEDLQPSEPVTLRIDKIRFSGDTISTVNGTKGTISLQFTVGKNGAVSLDGPVSLDPLTAQLKTNVRSLDLAAFRSYTADQYKVIMTGGRFSTGGSFSVASPKDGMKIRYQGKVTIAKFNAIDKVNAEDFLKFDSLDFSRLDVSTNPLRILIKQIALSDFYSRIIINPDGTLNTQGLSEQGTGQQTAGKAAPAAAPPPLPAAEEKKEQVPDIQAFRKQKLVKIDEVTVQGGTIHFSDRSIKPSYTARMLEIAGRVSGLTSEEEKFADVELRGLLEGGSPLEMTGKINPLRDDLYIALKVDLQNMDLSTTSPYAGRHIGYTIEKGKMNLGMEYLIEKKKLEAKNTVFLDQFTLGEYVESPDATKMPVKLAIALLKNRKGEIHLDLPVTGTTDDPEFRVGKIIWKIIFNVLVKAAASPFALLGAIIGGGGGEEMSYVDFAYGAATLTDQEQKKIDKLMTVLQERPALKIDIEGHADLLNDREGLKQELMQKKVKAQKLKALVKGDRSESLDNVVVTKEEYPNYLKQAYKAEKFPKPSNFLGIAKDIPVPEMEKLMLTHAVVNDDMLRDLAKERARVVYAYMLKAKKVEKERIFLVDPKSVQPEKKEKVRDSRVDFRLK
ncbi:MAG TPA: DUF748 domain-containing protein [Dissulfurispiraceae bacterium]|nr:DUF748 domain-containing protein [Dissulfurispiraceae bacterium]